MMIENCWSRYLFRHHSAAKSDIDKRAIAICNAWITWADGFGIAPLAELAAKLATAETSSACVIARQITLKLAKECPVVMPVPPPHEIWGWEEAGGDIEEGSSEALRQVASIPI